MVASGLVDALSAALRTFHHGAQPEDCNPNTLWSVLNSLNEPLIGGEAEDQINALLRLQKPAIRFAIDNDVAFLPGMSCSSRMPAIELAAKLFRGDEADEFAFSQAELDDALATTIVKQGDFWTDVMPPTPHAGKL